MATVYDPIAKDGSLNTTEATPRNIADVLAEGLKGIEDALPPTYTEGDGIDISNDEISVDTTFTEASTRANIASDESFSTILGKIKKFFTDLKTVAFTGAYSDLTGQPTIPTDFVSKANGGTFGGDVTIATSSGDSRIILGSSSSVGQTKFINGNYRTSMYPQTLTANRTIEIPDKSGTLAVEEDIPISGFSSSYCTIDSYSQCHRVGRLYACNLRVTLTADVPNSTSFITTPFSVNGSSHTACATDVENYSFDMLGNSIRARTAMTSGSIVQISFTAIV